MSAQRSLSFPLVVGALAVIAACGSSYKLVGFSKARFDGAAGIRTFSAACAEDFGPDGRFCNASEVARTKDPPKTRFAWVGDVGQKQRDDCSNWSRVSGSGRTVGRWGDFNRVVCSHRLPVACCAPVN